MRTYVFAANYQHFVYWCQQNKINHLSKNYQYVSHVQQILGLTPEENKFVFYETWREHPDAMQFWDQYRQIQSLRGLKVIPIDRSPQVEEQDGIFTWKFWKATLERMVRSFAAGIIGLNVANVTDLTSIGWQNVLWAGIFMSGASLLFALAGSRFGGDTTDPSFFKKD